MLHPLACDNVKERDYILMSNEERSINQTIGNIETEIVGYGDVEDFIPFLLGQGDYFSYVGSHSDVPFSVYL
jgi:hypothetical protein